MHDFGIGKLYVYTCKWLFIPLFAGKAFNMFWFPLCIYLDFLAEPFFTEKSEEPKYASPNSSPLLCLKSTGIQRFSDTKTTVGFPKV